MATGRPRSEESRLAVLRATSELLRELGFEGVTISGIAARAGVGRQTIYRWWPSTSAIVAEAVLEGLVTLRVLAAPRAPHGDGAVRAAIGAVAETFTDADNAALVRALAAAAAEDAQAAAALYSTLTRPTQDELAAAIRAQGASRGQLDADLLAEVILGALLYRVLTRTPVTADLVEALAGLSARP